MNRRERLLSVLLDHPDGLAAGVLFARAGEPGGHQAMIAALRRLAAAGAVELSDDRRDVSGALVRPVWRAIQPPSRLPAGIVAPRRR